MPLCLFSLMQLPPPEFGTTLVALERYHMAPWPGEIGTRSEENVRQRRHRSRSRGGGLGPGAGLLQDGNAATAAMSNRLTASASSSFLRRMNSSGSHRLRRADLAHADIGQWLNMAASALTPHSGTTSRLYQSMTCHRKA